MIHGGLVGASHHRGPLVLPEAFSVGFQCLGRGGSGGGGLSKVSPAAKKVVETSSVGVTVAESPGGTGGVPAKREPSGAGPGEAGMVGGWC
jgi:hypothetical protein